MFDENTEPTGCEHININKFPINMIIIVVNLLELVVRRRG